MPFKAYKYIYEIGVTTENKYPYEEAVSVISNLRFACEAILRLTCINLVTLICSRMIG